MMILKTPPMRFLTHMIKAVPGKISLVFWKCVLDYGRTGRPEKHLKLAKKSSNISSKNMRFPTLTQKTMIMRISPKTKMMLGGHSHAT